MKKKISKKRRKTEINLPNKCGQYLGCQWSPKCSSKSIQILMRTITILCSMICPERQTTMGMRMRMITEKMKTNLIGKTLMRKEKKRTKTKRKGRIISKSTRLKQRMTIAQILINYIICHSKRKWGPIHSNKICKMQDKISKMKAMKRFDWMSFYYYSLYNVNIHLANVIIPSF